MNEFWLCFVPLFVSVDAIGTIPVFLGLTTGMDRAHVRLTVLQSVITAFAVSLVFLYGGSAVLRFLGITVADFMVAGGIVLFVFSLSDMLSLGHRHSEAASESLGIMPLGVPLIAGPAVLTSILLLQQSYGATPTLGALFVNVCIIPPALFLGATTIHKLLGESGAKAFSRISGLFMCAIAVMMVRKGIIYYMTHSM